jgi:hypothetical protein
MGGKRIGLIGVAVGLALVLVACNAIANDYTGDRKADFVYITPADGVWHLAGSATPLFTGTPSDEPVAGDYSASGTWEPAVLRGRDWVLPAPAAAIHYDPPGLPSGPPSYPTWAGASTFGPSDGVLAVPAAYDGGGKTVPAYYSLVDGSWWIMGHPSPVTFGLPPNGDFGWDVPVPADYDGDGKADIAVFRPTDSTFHILPSAGGAEQVVTMGLRSAIPVPGDYDGVGKAQPAIASVDGSKWFRAGSATPFATFTVPSIGTPVPAPADYDGNGTTDAAWINATPPSGSSAPLEVDGRGVIATADAPGNVLTTTLPSGTLESVVALVFYDRCLNDPNFHTFLPTHCPPA